MKDHVDEEVNEMGFKKFGVGEVGIEIEENSLVQKAANAQFTEEDEEALARENASTDKEI
jgi:hypothetical protein